jgi:glycerol-3-phosphate O-acyltransferase / dihydroxyacetone phosphate acyltransferase
MLGPMRRLATALLRWLAEAVVRLYYPRRSVEGLGHLPPAGPALYVANHPNGLMDPLLLRAVTGRRIRFLAKSTFWGNPFGRLAMDAFQCLKVYRHQDLAEGAGAAPLAGPASAARDRNEESFARCRAELAAGAELALYPEGTSHSEPRLKPLKSGAARIALSAAAEARARGGNVPLLIPVGSYYQQKTSFRSGMHLIIGPPIDFGRAQDVFAADAAEGVEQLMELIRVRLEELVLHAESHELLEGIARVADGTASTPDHGDPARQTARTRELLNAYARLKASNPARVEEITGAARRYARLLQRLGIDDPWALELPPVTWASVAGALARAIALAPLALWGFAGSGIPCLLSGMTARRMTRDDDVLSTTKMITAFAFLMGAWPLEAVAVGIWLGAGWGLASFVSAPLAAYAALRFGETLRGLAEAIRHLGWRRQSTTARRLLERRRRLAEDVARALRDGA